MRIAICVRILWSAGTQKFAIEQAKALATSGHSVTLFFLRRSTNGNVYGDLLKDIDYRVISEKNTSLLVSLYDWITGIFMANRKGEGRVDYNLIRRFKNYVGGKYDLVICQDQWAGLAGYYTWRKYATPYFVIIHERVNNFPWVKGVKRLLVKFALHYQKIVLLNASKVLSLTRSVADTVETLYANYKLKCTDNFPGLEMKEFVNYSGKFNTLALVSYWNEVKFPEMYIDLFETLREYNFLMIGNWISDDYKDSFILKLKDRGLLERVTIVSGLDEKEKNSIISKCKFYIRFGEGEFGPGYGTIEAIELGVPVIVNKELGISSYLEHYDCSLIVDKPTDLDVISEFIRRSDNPVIYKRLQDEIRRFIEDYTWKSHVDKLLGLQTKEE